MTAEEGMTIIHDLSEIPAFATEADEARYWDCHAFSDELAARAEPIPPGELPPPRPRTRPIPIRLEGRIVERLKALAARRGTGYQTLLKEFVVERLYEEERREGIISSPERPMRERSTPSGSPRPSR